MTNYQEEIAEYFEEGKELAIYSSIEELQEKVEFYLSHEEQRSQIALAGCRKVKELFSLKNQWKKLRDTCLQL